MTIVSKRYAIIGTGMASLLLLVSFWGIAQVDAHANGVSIETVVDGYLVDIGYSPEVLYDGVPARFDFLLFDQATGQEVDFTDLWLRIEKDERLLFAGSIAQPYFGEAGVSQRFIEPGAYTGFVRYQSGRESLVESTFAFTVVATPIPLHEQQFSFWPIIYGFGAGLFLGALGVLAVSQGRIYRHPIVLGALGFFIAVGAYLMIKVM